jgi:hypothetical protein
LRYWFFDGKSPTGPFGEEELKNLPGFNAQSLICPENAQSPNQWKPAQYYLIKPPPRKAREEAQLPEKNRMGRLAEIEEAEAAKKEKESAFPASQRQAPPSRRTGLKILLISSLLASVVYFFPKILSYFRSRVPALHLPSSSSSTSQDLGSRAIEIAKNFPVFTAERKYPLQIEDILLPSKWKTPKTLGAALNGKALGALSLDTLMLLKAEGLSPISGQKALAQNADAWKNQGEAFLMKNLAFGWTTFSIPNSDSHVRIEAASPTPWSLAGRKDIFDCDVKNKTLKPLNFNAWFDLNSQAARRWAAQNGLFWQNIDADMVEAPAYSLQEMTQKTALQQKPGRKKAKAAMPVKLSPQPKEKHRISPAPVPEPAKTISPQTPADSSKPHKNAENMSLDELNKYLNRGQGAGQPSPNPSQNPQ